MGEFDRGKKQGSSIDRLEQKETFLLLCLEESLWNL